MLMFSPLSRRRYADAAAIADCFAADIMNTI